jgi:hypothetical protein
MLARRLRHHPARTGAELAADLAAARDRLAVMCAENLSVAAAFDLSYADLTAVQQRLFRRLGLAPGPDIDAYAAAALGDTSLESAHGLLDELYDRQLHSYPPVRWRLRPRSLGPGRGPRARSAISTQKSISCLRRISCHGALRRLRDVLVSRVCCLRQNASLISTRGWAPFGGYGQSSKAQPSTQVVPGAADVAVATVSRGSREGR